MKRYTFPLAGLARVRAIRDDLAAAELGRARRDLEQAQHLAAARRSDHERHRVANVRQSIGELTDARLRGARSAERVAQARHHAAEADERVRTRTVERRRAHQEIEVLERLERRLLAEHHVELARVERLEVDDLAGNGATTPRRPGAALDGEVRR